MFLGLCDVNIKDVNAGQNLVSPTQCYRVSSIVCYSRFDIVCSDLMPVTNKIIIWWKERRSLDEYIVKTNIGNTIGIRYKDMEWIRIGSSS